jgi:branched-chain amino acid transport system permease protein
MRYFFHILTMINIYAILALSLNLLVGYAGLLSISHAAFYGIGAYIGALCMVKLGLSFLLATLLAVGGAVLLSFVISIPSLRLKGDYFVLASLGFQIIVFAILYNWTAVTGGSFGILGIPRPQFFAIEISSPAAYFLFSGIVAVACIGAMYLIGHSSLGLSLKRIRDDELAASVMHHNIPRLKMTAFAIAAGFAAIAGVLFAMYAEFIDPTSFTLAESIFILSIIIIGGAGNIVGPLVGTVLLVTLPEVLRFAGIPDAIAANMRQVFYGLLIILLMRYRPLGLLGEYRFK